MKTHPESPYFKPEDQPILNGIYDFRKGEWGFRSKGTPDYLLMLTLGGEGVLIDDTDQPYSATRGHLVLIPPSTPHNFGPAEGMRWKVFFIHFDPRPHWTHWLPDPKEPGGIRCSDQTAVLEDLTALFSKLFSQSAQPGSHQADFLLNTVEEILLRCDSVPAECKPVHLDPRIQKAVEYITEHQNQPIRVKQVARASCLSESRLAHLFRSQMGCPVQTYVERLRMEQAKTRLCTRNDSIQETAEAIGFENAFYFSNRFRKYTGQSPSAFRKNQRSIH